MKRLTHHIAFGLLTVLSTTSVLPVMSGGCSSHMNNKAEIKCAENDKECQSEKASKIDFKDSLKS